MPQSLTEDRDKDLYLECHLLGHGDDFREVNPLGMDLQVDAPRSKRTVGLSTRSAGDDSPSVPQLHPCWAWQSFLDETASQFGCQLLICRVSLCLSEAGRPCLFPLPDRLLLHGFGQDRDETRWSVYRSSSSSSMAVMSAALCPPPASQTSSPLCDAWRSLTVLVCDITSGRCRSPLFRTVKRPPVHVFTFLWCDSQMRK